MAALITTLIDKTDSNELVRDQLAAILAVEVANQRVLAAAAAKDPNDYSFTIYTEKSRPWETDKFPCVNIIFDNDRFDNKNSNNIDRQRVIGTYHIDCYAKKNTNDSQTGDERASREADRIARLVRNILMMNEYTYLLFGSREALAGTIPTQLVFSRYIQRREKWQPDIRTEGFENVIACRLTTEVVYDEFSPQTETVDFETIINSCIRGEDDEVLFGAEYDMTV